MAADHTHYSGFGGSIGAMAKCASLRQSSQVDAIFVNEGCTGVIRAKLKFGRVISMTYYSATMSRD